MAKSDGELLAGGYCTLSGRMGQGDLAGQIVRRGGPAAGVRLLLGAVAAKARVCACFWSFSGILLAPPEEAVYLNRSVYQSVSSGMTRSSRRG